MSYFVLCFKKFMLSDCRFEIRATDLAHNTVEISRTFSLHENDLNVDSFNTYVLLINVLAMTFFINNKCLSCHAVVGFISMKRQSYSRECI